MAAELVAACADKADAERPGEGILLRADVARAAGGDPAAAARVVNALGLDLYRRLATAGDNLVFSPASVAIALAMTRAGARGATATEMDEVLHVDDPAGLARSMNGLTRALDSRTATFPVPDEDDLKVELSIANSLWGQQGLTFEPDFLEVLAGEYGAGLRTVDFVTQAEPARRAINAWVSSETAERIPELLVPGLLDETTRLVLVNAAYLKAPWASPFEKEITSNGSFTRPDAPAVTVPFMRDTLSLPYAAADGWRAVQLPYAGQQLAMLVLLPDGAADTAQLSAAVVAGLVGRLAPEEVALALPRWDIESKVDLGDVLGALGMPTAFTDRADFSGMTRQEPLAIDSVVHQANITVDEAGTEASAATAVSMRATGALVPSQEFTVDRPFAFVLRDVETGAILFLGRVTDPSQTRR